MKLLLALLLMSLPSPARAADGVILLHGLCRTPASMRKMASSLAAAGYVVVNRGYPSRTATIEALSEATLGTALQDPRLAGCPRVHFVSHSLGGILIRDYFARHPGKLSGRVVMLGPPNQGSEVVDRLGEWRLFKKLNGPAGGMLGTRDDSAPNLLPAVDFELGVVAGDRSINWINSAMIAGPDDGKVSVKRTGVEGMKEQVVVHATHPYLMKNRKVIELTLRFLRSGSFGSEG
ncbi:alpha/beta fold hydrolase [Haloferula sargassicola]|uniref:AB hydrolase-1 domain-containing protein n=1 Tax=Haloferula sargassicola TaxID=490096 RepID=A0ABP9UT00_9BACT